MKSIIECIDVHVLEKPDETIFTFLDETAGVSESSTFLELQQKARNIAGFLLDNYSSGERILISYPQNLSFIQALLGCMYAGMIAVPVPPPITPDMSRKFHLVKKDADPVACFTDKMIGSFLNTNNDQKDSTFGHLAGMYEDIPLIMTDELHEQWVNNFRYTESDPSDIFLLQYTSGSTGDPKGVKITHRNLMANEEMISNFFDCSKDTVAVGWQPFYHDMGLIGNVFQPCFQGIQAILFSPQAFLKDPLMWLDTITQFNGTISGGPGFAFALCVKHATQERMKQLDLSKWRVAYNGSEPIRKDTLDSFYRTFAPCGFKEEALYPCYGLAENTLIVSGGLAQEKPKHLSLSIESLKTGTAVPVLDASHPGVSIMGVGKTCSGQEIAIVDPETFKKCSDESIGEIWVKGEAVAAGYWNRPQLTGEVFNAYTCEGEGPFLRTGDLAFLFKTEIYVTGRMKDLIIVNGKNYYPQDIEQSIEKCHPDIRKGRTVAFSIEENGEKVCIAAEYKGDNDSTKDIYKRIQDAVSTEYALKLHDIALVTPRKIPLTTSGKVRRQYTKQQYLENSLDVIDCSKGLMKDTYQIKTDDSGLNIKIRDLVASVLNVDSEIIDPEAPLGQYGLTSIAVVEIAAKLEKITGKTVTPFTVFSRPTINTLSEYLREDQTNVSEVREKRDSEELIAIVGLNCRFPKSDDPVSFWQHLIKGESLVSQFPDDRKGLNRFASDSEDGYARAGFLSGIKAFDAAFFGISEMEAVHMDPQHRKYLETVWKTIEDAGYATQTLSGTKTGVFTGVSTFDYNSLITQSDIQPTVYSATGSAFSMLSNRISYVMNFQGPSEVVDTACSSSLVAVHRAVTSIQLGECDQAIAGGVNALLASDGFEALKKGGFLSKDGHCKPFDDDANGYVRGEGAGAVFLKPLSKAIEDNDHIYCVIKGSGVSHGGQTASLTSPGEDRQAELLINTFTKAGVLPQSLSYIEAHGTGTALGDPIEINALKKAFSAFGTSEKPSCGVGSVKSNIGHLEAASGIAGVIKVALAMKHNMLPPTVNFQKLNTYIDIENTPFYIIDRPVPWHMDSEPLRAGISSFGFGGSYAHIIAECYQADSHVAPHHENDTEVFVFSAKTKSSLHRYMKRFYRFMSMMDDGEGKRSSFSDIAYTLQVGREHHKHRLAILSSDNETLVELIKQWLDTKGQQKDMFTGSSKDTKNNMVAPDPITSETFATWWVNGGNYDWQKMAEKTERKRMPLPTYEFEQTEFWITESSPQTLTVEEKKERVETYHALTVEHVIFFLKEKISDLTELDLNDVDITTNFTELDINSIQLIETISEMNEKFGIETPVSIIQDCPDIQSLATYSVTGETGIEPDLYNEALLDETITYDDLPRTNNTHGNDILLTGATGFLGIFLLRELLKNTKATIHCIVRAKDTKSGFVRLQTTMQSFMMTDCTLDDRIRVIMGDLSEERFGMAQIEYDVLSETIDTIYHCGAIVDWMKPYDSLKNINVRGTKYILRFAGNKRVKNLHYISSLGVLPLTGQPQHWIESDLPSPEGFTNGYAQTKWVAETLCHEARKRGLPVNIYRFDYVAGTCETGAMKETDFIIRLIKGCIQLSCIPAEETNFDILSVDYLSSIIVKISQKSDAINKTYHLINRQPFLISDFVNLIREFGYKIERVPLTLWKKHIATNPTSELYPLYPFITKYDVDDFRQYFHSTIDNTNTLKALYEIDENDITSVPSGADVMRQAIRFFVNMGYLPPSNVSYVMERQKKYWINQLKGTNGISGLPLAFHSSTSDEKTGKVRFELQDTLVVDVDRLCKHLEVDRSCVLLATLQMLLHRYSGQEMITLAVPYAEKHAEKATKGKVTIINNMFQGHLTSEQIIQNTRQYISEALINMDIESDFLQGLIAEGGNSECCDVFFSYSLNTTGVSERSINLFPLTIEDIWQKSNTLMLSVEASSEASIVCGFYYAKDKLAASTIGGMARHYKKMLAEICAFPVKALSEITMLEDGEFKKIINEWNHTFCAFPETKNVPELFQQHVEAYPNHFAVCFLNEEITYKQLSRRILIIEDSIRQTISTPGNVIALYQDRSIDMVAGMMAILTSDNIYLPIDPALPDERIHYILEDSGATLLLTESRMKKRLMKTALPTLVLEELSMEKEELQTAVGVLERPGTRDLSEIPAYMIYTSGSTGLPKGVVLHHRGFLNALFTYNQAIQLKAGQRHLAITSISFDASIWELFLPLITGGTIELIPRDMSLDGIGLKNWLDSHHVSAMFATPATLRMLEFAGYHGNPDMVIATGGDVLPEDLSQKISHWGKRVYNFYGPTEGTIAASVAPIQKGHRVTIGKPLANTKIYLLDTYLSPVPTGMIGEIYIAGSGVGLGYHNRPELNNNTFIPNPFDSDYPVMYKTGDLGQYLEDGQIEYVGRVDHQVKIRGYRVELGEIERLVMKDEHIRDCVCSVGKTDTITAYIIPNKDADSIDFNTIDQLLAQRLPEYMRVHNYHVMDVFPLNNSGKVNRNALPEPDSLAKREEYKPPVTSTEKQIYDIWKHAFETENEIGINTNFLEIGGNSIVAVQILTEINKAFKRDLKIQEFYTNLTIEELAQVVVKEEKREVNYIGKKGSIDFFKDAELGMDFNIASSVASASVTENVKAIFVSGATGFLGAYLVSALLNKTTADIYCLVRAQDEMEGFERIKNNLVRYMLWDNTFSSRIVSVPGDLMKRSFGLSREKFDTLAKVADALFHNGSIVNFAYPYSFLKKANVDGTREMIRLATYKKLKSLYYISSIGVFDSLDVFSKDTVFEHDLITNPEDLLFGYSQTKWVAEKMVSTAGNKGVPVTIFRPSLILADTKTGASNIRDIMHYTIKACAMCGCIPDIDFEINGVPVNYVADSIVDISLKEEAHGEIIHISNATGCSVRALVSTMSERYGELPVVDHQEWINTLRKEAEKNEYLAQVETEVKNEINLMHGQRLPEYSLDNTVKILPSYKENLPDLSAGYWKTYLNALSNDGHFDNLTETAGLRWKKKKESSDA